jgi:putative ABC transport system ATP-binding protein
MRCRTRRASECAQNISIALKALPSSPASDPLGIEDAADAVGIDGVLDAPAYSLSGGERIRVAFARLLVRKPALVLADEPTAALDAENANEIHVLLRSLADAGSTVLTATHDRDLIERCDATIGL